MFKKKSKEQKIKDKLKLGKRVSNHELNKICFRYGAIIFRLRKQGWIIQTERVGNNGLFMYTAIKRGDDER